MTVRIYLSNNNGRWSYSLSRPGHPTIGTGTWATRTACVLAALEEAGDTARVQMEIEAGQPGDATDGRTRKAGA